ncbi:hypothetical protein C8J57DRAFT_1229141 [Mycena rebaudengoi]|nr:hypothetical protein C8J57DRAFT_1229141 [Mycena rebaudengoi]
MSLDPNLQISEADEWYYPLRDIKHCTADQDCEAKLQCANSSPSLIHGLAPEANYFATSRPVQPLQYHIYCTATTMATVHQLPDELLDYIISLISKENDLWTLCRVSSHFRRLTILPFLSRFKISASDIQAGIIALSRSFFIILVVAHMNPIRRLVISEMDYDYELLASVLSVAAPIPDILIYNTTDFFGGTIGGTAFAGAYSSNCLQSTVDCQARLDNYIRDLPRFYVSVFDSTSKKIMEAVIFAIPLLIQHFIWLILSCLTMIAWTYRRTFGPPWDQVFRIREDLSRLYGSHWMRIQPLSTAAGDFALVTIGCQLTKPFRFRHIPGLAPEAYSALLAALELPNHPTQLRVEQQSGLSHSDLLGFLQRHPRIRNLTIDQDSLDPSSFVARWNVPQTVRVLTAPASYIPKLLPTQPNLAHIDITFPLTTARDRHGKPETELTGAFDLAGYYEALDAVASFPGTDPVWLALTLPLPATSLPWLNIADASVLNGNSRPETRLRRVQHLGLASQTKLAFSEDIIRDLLPPWLALFPALTHLRFRLPMGSVAATAAHQRRELARAIADACPNVVHQNIETNDKRVVEIGMKAAEPRAGFTEPETQV